MIKDLITTCSICKTQIKDVFLPELVEEYEWTGTWRKRNGKEIQFWYCPKHSIEAILNFEGQI